MTGGLRGPDFLGVGMSKSGTTWLDHVLRSHPGIWLPPIKELHFLDEYFSLVQRGEQSRYFSPDPYARRRWRRVLWSELKRNLRFPSALGLAWSFRYLFGERSLERYPELFPSDERVRGEITPGYAVLSEESIVQVRRHCPNARVILLFRDPVERVWSHARMELAGRCGRSVDAIPVEELERFLFEDEGVQRRQSYVDILDRWCNVFGDRQVFVGLLDDIEERPAALVSELLDFLAVPAGLNDPGRLSTRTFVGPAGRIPPAIHARLIDRHAGEAVALCQRIGRPEVADRWLEDAPATASAGPV